MDPYLAFDKQRLYCGRLLSGSKSGYSQAHPNNKALFNANIVIESKGKIWYGDIDLTTESDKLIEIAKELNENLYVLYEMDCRFDAENWPIEKHKQRAMAVISPDGKVEIRY